MPLDKDTILLQSADKYLNDEQLDFFKALLIDKQAELITRVRRRELSITEVEQVSDVADLGTQEEARSFTLQLLHREREDAADISAALSRIESGEYGYCDMTGEEIGLKRLMLYPTANHTVESQTRLEQMGRHMRARAG